MDCTFCRETLSDQAIFCATCGKPVRGRTPASKATPAPVETEASAAARRLREQRTTAGLHADAQLRQGLRDDAKGWGCMAALLGGWCTIAGLVIVVVSVVAGDAGSFLTGLLVAGFGLLWVFAWQRARAETDGWSEPGAKWISRGRTYWTAIKVVLYATVIGSVVVAMMSRDD